MTREQLVAFLESECAEIIRTVRDKNHDYTGGSANPFLNFDAVELLDICDAEVGQLTRLTDKFMRVRAFVKLGVLKVKGESITDTCRDGAAYFLLLAAKIEARRRKQEQKAPLLTSERVSFAKGPRENQQITFAKVERRADTEWLLIFDSPAIDSIRGPSAADVISKAALHWGAPQPAGV